MEPRWCVLEKGAWNQCSVQLREAALDNVAFSLCISIYFRPLRARKATGIPPDIIGDTHSMGIEHFHQLDYGSVRYSPTAKAMAFSCISTSGDFSCWAAIYPVLFKIRLRSVFSVTIDCFMYSTIRKPIKLSARNGDEFLKRAPLGNQHHRLRSFRSLCMVVGRGAAVGTRWRWRAGWFSSICRFSLDPFIFCPYCRFLSLRCNQSFGSLLSVRWVGRQ